MPFVGDEIANTHNHNRFRGQPHIGANGIPAWGYASGTSLGDSTFSKLFWLICPVVTA